MIRVAFEPDAHQQALAVARCRSALRQRGVRLVDATARADVLLIHSESMRSPPSHCRTVILERQDSAQLSRPVREIIERDNVRLVLKHSRLRDLEDYNRYTGPVHRHMLRERLELPAWGRDVRLSAEALGKIRLGFSQAAWPRLDPHAEPVHLNQYRPIEVFFAGQIARSQRGREIGWHRRRCVDALLDRDRTVAGRGRPFGDGLYVTMCRRSKIMVAPWGWGEQTFREYEGTLDGCLVIRPRTAHCEQADLPGHIIDCEPDFSDLDERIEQALGLWPDSTARRLAERRRLVEARAPETIAARLAALLQEAADG